MNDIANSNWSLPRGEPAALANRTLGDIEDWHELTRRVHTAAVSNGWSKAEVARRIGMPSGTFSQWYDGTYAGRLDAQNLRARQWLDALEETSALASGIPASPGFVQTKTAGEVITTLSYAQALPEMAVITLGAGMGKTFACRHYAASRPHAYHVTMTPHTRTCHGMLVEIAAALGITQRNPATLHRAIGEKLQRNGKTPLLIVDEAQNLVDQAVDQLRSLLDLHECGIALVGNEEVYRRFTARRDGPSYAQIRRRIGKRLRRLAPYEEDITALIDAWGISDEASRKLLIGIGHKPGALGQIDKTLKLAGLLAAGDGGAIAEKHIRAAWANRDVED